MYNNHRGRRLQYTIGKTYRSSTIWSPLGLHQPSGTVASQPRRNPVSRMGCQDPGGLMPLNICEGAPCFGRKRFLKAGEQGLIKDFLCFGLLSDLKLRHSQVEKRIGVE